MQADEQKWKRLLDAAKRLVESGASEAEIMKSLTDIGVPVGDANSLLLAAKGIGPEKKAFPKTPGESFWESEGEKFFGKPVKKSGGQEKKESLMGNILKKGEGEKVQETVIKKSRSPAPYGEGAAKKEDSVREILPLRVSDFDRLIERGGLKRGDTILLSGGCGTGKTTFGMQSLYYGAMHNEPGVYITLEESSEKMKENMKENFGWDLEALERENKLAIIKIDPLTIARAVEATLTRERGGLYIEFEEFELPFQLNLPFKPDRVIIDSLSALSIAFMENAQAYRQYLRHLFETLEKFTSVNIVLGETEQEPGIYSRSGIEEFLADGVVVFYNIKIHNIREKALEILKLRSSNHEKRITPYKITPRGIEIYIDQELFREE